MPVRIYDRVKVDHANHVRSEAGPLSALLLPSQLNLSC